MSEEYIGVEKDLLRSNVQVVTPQTACFDFVCSDRQTLLKRLKQMTEQRGFDLKMPTVKVSQVCD